MSSAPPSCESTPGPLTARQLITLASVADTLVPRGGAFPLGAADVGVAARLNRYLTDFDASTRRHIGLLLTAWEYSTLLSRHAKPFTRLTERERAEYLAAAVRSRNPLRRVPAVILKQLCGLTFGAAPEVEAAFGFTHTCVHTGPASDGPRLRPLMFPDIAGTVDVHADACIVGSGAGGAVVAKELAEAGLSVVVIEEGGYFTRSDFHGAPFERILRLYRDHGATTAWGRPPIAVPVGKAVGGTTVVNSGTCFRTPDAVLRDWESTYGIEGIDPGTMAAVFDRVEDTLGVTPAPWEIIGRNAEVFDRGVKALGLRGAPIRRNIRGCRGCGVCAFGCPSDAKQAMHLTYLPQAEARGARIYARCRAERIVVENGRAAGVAASILDPHSEQLRGRLHVRAPIVVAAAGAIHTPLLLRTNRIGRRSGQLGRHLRIHPSIAVSAVFAEDVSGWRGTLQSYFVDQLMESDQVMIEVTNPIPSLAVAASQAIGPEAKDVMAAARHVAAAGLFVADSSAGRVWQLGRRGRPVITYQLNRQDTRRLIRGIALAAEIFLAAGARAVHTGLTSWPEVRSTADIATLRTGGDSRPDALSPTGFHPMGTCRMGRHPQTSVVNPMGETHDVRGLYVADASIFPTCTGVNPQVSIMAFATRIAAGIVQRG